MSLITGVGRMIVTFRLVESQLGGCALLARGQSEWVSWRGSVGGYATSILGFYHAAQNPWEGVFGCTVASDKLTSGSPRLISDCAMEKQIKFQRMLWPRWRWKNS